MKYIEGGGFKHQSECVLKMKKKMNVYIVVSPTKYFLLCYSEEAISLIQ